MKISTGWSAKGDGEQLEIAFLEMLASDVVVNFNVLGVFMEDIIMSNVDSTMIVTIKRNDSGLWSIYVSQEPAKPNKLAGGVGKGTILCLSIGLVQVIHFFLEVSIKESILYIHLIKRATTNCSHNNKTSDKCKVSNISKCFLIVNAILLSKALGNEASLVSFNRSISLGLDLVNPLTTYYRLARRQINHILSVILMKGI